MKLFAALLLITSFQSFAQCVHPQQDGTLIFTADTSASCSGYWFVPASEYSAYVSSVEITVADVTSAFVWGFGTVVFFSGLAFKIGAARSVVRKA